MKSFLVIGLGRFGRSVACELGALGQEVLAIDNNEENVQHIADSVTQAICGDAQDEAVLRSLGVGNFDCCVVAIGTDIEANILITVMLKELGAKQVVCKALSALHARVLERVGADRVIQPEKEMGQRLAQHLGRTNVVDFSNGMPIPPGDYAWHVSLDGDEDHAVDFRFCVPKPVTTPVIG